MTGSDLGVAAGDRGDDHVWIFKLGDVVGEQIAPWCSYFSLISGCHSDGSGVIS